MKLRIALTIIALCLYVGLFNVYWYELTEINIGTSKIFYNCITFGAVAFFVADLKAGFVSDNHRQFNLLLILCVLINYLLIIATHAQWIGDERTDAMYYGFNLSVFAITLVIFICGWKYKTFKD